MTEPAPVAGAFAALPTPLDEKRLLDVKALEYLTDYLADRKVDGVALFTDGAEDLLLSAEERRTILKHVTQRLKRRSRLVVAVSALASTEAAELAKLARDKGAEAVLVSLPKLPGIGYRELYRHVDRIAKASDAPILLVARPLGALEALLPEELSTLVAHPAVAGVLALHAGSPALQEWGRRFKGRTPALLAGSFALMDRGATAGVTGAICSALTVASAQVVGRARLTSPERSALEGLAELIGPAPSDEPKDGVQRLAVRLARRSLEAPMLPLAFAAGLIKEALRLQGMPIRGEVRAPFEPPRAELVERLKGFMLALRLLA